MDWIYFQARTKWQSIAMCVHSVLLGFYTLKVLNWQLYFTILISDLCFKDENGSSLYCRAYLILLLSVPLLRYQNDLPKKLKSRGKDAHFTHEELVQTIKWKLAVSSGGN